MTAPDLRARPNEPGGAFDRLVRIMKRLRGEGGCPWDREQTLESLRGYLIEETYEVLDALDHGSVDDHLEELGDLLLQIVFQSEIRREEQAFDAAMVANAICDKLVRRHPHVFEDAEAGSSDEVVSRWEAIKASEKSGRRSRLDGVPRALPALARAARVTEKAARVGFDWPDISGPRRKIDEELSELDEAARSGHPDDVEAELGDVLFAAVNYARHAGIAAEDALRRSVDRFETRFRAVEAKVEARGRAVAELSLMELDELWEEVKSESSEASDSRSPRGDD